jgi:hypothetical protein
MENQQTKSNSDRIATIGLCLGIASIILWEFSIVPILAIILGVASLIRRKTKWKAIVAIVLGIIFLLLRISHGYIGKGTNSSNTIPQAVVTPSQPHTKTQPNTPKAPSPNSTIDAPAIKDCTSFDYTKWSHCATDGTQSRVITAAYPEGCAITENISANQEQQCQYVALNPSFAELVNKFVGQIHNAPDQTITTQYFAGQTNDIYIATNKWKLSSDGTTLLLESTSKNRATGAVTDHIILADTNADFLPDEYSYDGDSWYNLANQTSTVVQNYKTVWAVDSAYFAAYLLDY